MIRHLVQSILFFGIIFLQISPVTAEGRFDSMISPISNPTNFEDPRAISEARLIYMHHDIEGDFYTGGGDIQIYDLQLRGAVNDRLALMLTKFAYVDLDPDQVLPSASGLSNLTVGAKYAFYKDISTTTIMTGGVRWEIPTGDKDVLQGEGDGFFNPFLSGAVPMGELNFMAASGFRFPLDPDDSTFYDFDFHFDVPMGAFYPAFELNLVYVVDAGQRLPIDDEGLDFFSIGSTDSEGEMMLTGAIGGRYKVSETVDFGFAYQFPMNSSDGSDFTNWRITTDLIFHIL
ncbi:hypothetical protein OAO01_08020 [Oligoflexia bacterium]|nr:hypothetical protein [Oligoflexia bacterium]